MYIFNLFSIRFSGCFVPTPETIIGFLGFPRFGSIPRGSSGRWRTSTGSILGNKRGRYFFYGVNRGAELGLITTVAVRDSILETGRYHRIQAREMVGRGSIGGRYENGNQPPSHNRRPGSPGGPPDPGGAT